MNDIATITTIVIVTALLVSFGLAAVMVWQAFGEVPTKVAARREMLAAHFHLPDYGHPGYCLTCDAQVFRACCLTLSDEPHKAACEAVYPRTGPLMSRMADPVAGPHSPRAV